MTHLGWDPDRYGDYVAERETIARLPGHMTWDEYQAALDERDREVRRLMGDEK